MPLSIAERKHRMPHGAQKEIAVECEVDEPYVSHVMNDDVRAKTEPGKLKLRRVQVAIARKLRLRVEEVFPSEQPAAALAS